MTQYSAADLEHAINLALIDRNFPAVVDLLHTLAVVDPHRAQAVLDTVELARVLSGDR